MTSAVLLPPPGFDNLSVDERIEYVQSLWDHIAAKPEDVPVPDWHRKIVRDRLEAYLSAPTAGRPWSEVREILLQKLRSRSD